MAATGTYVIIGAGQAAEQAVGTLHAEGFAGSIVLIGEEPHLPYQRPPLSKKFLAGELTHDRLFIRPQAFYDGVDLRLGERVTAVSRAARTVVLADGGTVAYDKLLFATGARVRELNVPGADLPGVHYLRTIADVERIRAGLEPGARLVVVGGGYIGLEVAAVCVGLGLRVTVLEMADRVMSRVTSPVVSDFLHGVHARHGVDIRTGARVAAFEGDGRLQRVVCDGGESFAADLAVIGIGIVPNQDLAEAAGLACGNGIRVDTYGRTSDPAIFASGDCANHPSAFGHGRVRLESVANAIDQTKVAAAAMCGRLTPYDEVPWFWSDQYELKLQMAGLSQGADAHVVRGDPASGRFSVFYWHDGAVSAVDAVSMPSDYLVGRRMIAARAREPAARLADTSISIKEIGKPYM